MPAPQDYSLGAMPDPSQAFMGGLQQAGALQNFALQQQQQAQALQQQRMQQQVISSLVSNPNPTADDFSRATLLIPGMREHFKQSWDMHSDSQQKASLGEISQTYAAIQNGRPDLAASMLRDRAAALKNSGGDPAQIQAAESMAGVIEAHPEMARTMIGMRLASIPGGEKVVTNLAGLGGEQRAADKFPAELRQAGAVADKAVADAGAAQSEQVIKGVQAGNAPVATVLGNQKTAQEIKASQLAGEISQIDAQIKGADSETKRGELTLQRDKMIAEQAKQGQAQGVAAQDSQNLSTNALDTVQQIKDHPGMEGWNRPGQFSGAMLKKLPATERYALETYVETLKGQMAYSTLMAAKASSPTGASGFGALSEGELKLISNIAGNLNTDSPDFVKQLGKVERFLQKTQSTAVARPGLPMKGEAFVMKHPTFGAVNEGQVNALMKQYPGSTRDQVLQFLQQTGGK